MKLTSIYQVHFPASSCKLIGCSRWNSEGCQVLPASQSIRKDSLALRASYNCSFSQAGISWTSTKDTHWIGRWVWWGPLVPRGTSVSQAFSAQNLSSFFFCGGNISFRLDKGMWRLQIIAGLWVATNCLAWQIFIGRFTGGFLLAEVVSRLFRERSGAIGDVRDGPPFKQTLKTMMQQNGVFFSRSFGWSRWLGDTLLACTTHIFFWKGYMADWRMLKKSQLDELIVTWCYGYPMAISIFHFT